jgi:hypothetical protein
MREGIDAAVDCVDDIRRAADVRDTANAVFMGACGERRNDLRREAWRFERHAVDGDLEHVRVCASELADLCPRLLWRRHLAREARDDVPAEPPRKCKA